MFTFPHSNLIRYGFMLAMVALAALGRFLLSLVVGPQLDNATYCLATLITAFYAGIGPAVVALILGTVLGNLHVFGDPSIIASALVTRISLNMLVESLAIGFIDSTRRMQQRLQRSFDERLRRDEIARRQDERLRVTLRSIGDAVIATDPESRITWMNPVAEALTGWPEAEAVGLPLRSVFRTIKHDSSSSAEMPVSEVIAKGRVLRTVEPALLVSRDGHSRMVAYSTAPMKDASGQALGVVLVFHDDTERFRVTQRFVEQTRVAEAIHAMGQSLAAELNPDRIRRIVVEDAARLLNAEFAGCYSEGRPIPEAFVQKPRSTLDPYLGGSPLVTSILREHRVIRVKDAQLTEEHSVPVPPGARSFLAVRVESPSGRVFGALLFAHSEAGVFGATAERLAVGIAARAAVTLDNARLYHDLQASELRFRQMAEHISDVFWMTNPADGNILYISPAYEKMWGCPVETIYRNPTAYLDQIHEDDRARIADALDALKRGEATADEYRVIRPDGELCWVWDRGFPVWSESGTLQMIVGIVEDITERKAAEDALKESDRRKDEFLAMLAHELRNPLAPIRNALQLMKQTAIGEVGAWSTDLEMVERQVIHMTRLIDDLLDVSRISQGKITLKREPVAVVDIVEHAVATHRAIIENSGLSLEVVLPQDSPWILADPTRIEQVLGNLLNNATKYTDPGGKIELKVVRDDDCVILRVRDSGIGIPERFLPKVFDLFVQVEQPTERTRGGLGIGLSLVRDIVTMHGGSIEATSQGPGLGTEFVVCLPTIESPRNTLPAASDNASRPSPKRLCDPGSSKGRRVLVVDDNVDSASTLARLLTLLWKQDVRTAVDGPSALRTAREFLPELIFLDIGLPGLSGYQVAKELRATPEFATTTLVALTGWGQKSDFDKSRDSGFDRHLVKPVDIKLIAAIIEEIDKKVDEKPIAAS